MDAVTRSLVVVRNLISIPRGHYGCRDGGGEFFFEAFQRLVWQEVAEVGDAASHGGDVVPCQLFGRRGENPGQHLQVC